MLIAQSTRRREERSYNNDSHRKKIRKVLLLLKWTPIRIKPIVEIFKELKKTRIKKELKSSPAKLKSEFK